MKEANKKMEIKRYFSKKFNRSVDNDKPQYVIYINDENLTTLRYRKKQTKPMEHYKHVDSSKMNDYINRCVTNEENRYKEDLKYKEEQKTKLGLFLKDLKVNDVFHSSWGYEQTNVQFFQVLSVKKQTVELIEIGYETVPGSEGHDCCNVKPVKNSFLKDSKIFKKRITNPNWIKIDDVRSASKITDENRSFYKSWYY